MQAYTVLRAGKRYPFELQQTADGQGFMNDVPFDRLGMLQRLYVEAQREPRPGLQWPIAPGGATATSIAERR